MNIENVRPILDDDDLSWAIAEIEPYFDDEPEPNTASAFRFRFLLDRIEAYERERHSIADADPVRVLHAAIRDMGRSQADLGRLIGRTRASEILARKRRLTLEMIRTISEAWHLPIGALTKSYVVSKREPRVGVTIEHDPGETKKARRRRPAAA